MLVLLIIQHPDEGKGGGDYFYLTGLRGLLDAVVDKHASFKSIRYQLDIAVLKCSRLLPPLNLRFLYYSVLTLLTLT